MSRTIVWLVMAGAAVIAVALGVGGDAKMDERAAIERATTPAPGTATPPSTSRPEAAKPPDSPSAAVMAPSFDVARIGRDGRAVIAGRATPGAKIVLLDGGKEIARGEADS